MALTKVESSNINAIGFVDGKLIVEFKGGTRYQCAATQTEYDAFLKAESKGAHFARVFRARMTKVEEEE